MIPFFRKYHKWLGIFFSVFLIFYSLSGIVLNHRSLFAGLEVSRAWMPNGYTYDNWNLGALRGSANIGNDSILMYGNMGVYLANDQLEDLKDFSQGLDKGMDNRKIFKIHQSKTGNLYMATLNGAFVRNSDSESWKKIPIKTHDERFVGITEKDGQIILLSRSLVYISEDKPSELNFKEITLKNPSGYDNKIGLFKTMWFIHSGEIYGSIGKLLIDLVGLVFIFLSIGGIVYFFMPRRIKKKHLKGESIEQLKGFHQWNISWHNKIGYWFIPLLLLTTTTGIFLRPPGLIAIASAKVAKIPFTTLDEPSAWFDKLRAIHYDTLRGEYIMITDEAAYTIDAKLSGVPLLSPSQPPISIMGVTVLEQTAPNTYLVGSFSGLFLWNPDQNLVYDFQNKKPYEEIESSGPPIKNSSIQGWVKNGNHEGFYVDYGVGLIPSDSLFTAPEMPQIIKEKPISLWNLALEIHTARYFSFIFGIFYMLLIPIVGLSAIFILVSGFIVWWKKYRNKR
ncbi:MAG: hypothetical protein GQ527_00350 [Bacteroidales bacterium]|nr:hypothetical protein [Bacteroidales bacterium]